jgi:hypothetical protein
LPAHCQSAELEKIKTHYFLTNHYSCFLQVLQDVFWTKSITNPRCGKKQNHLEYFLRKGGKTAAF